MMFFLHIGVQSYLVPYSRECSRMYIDYEHCNKGAYSCQWHVQYVCIYVSSWYVCMCHTSHRIIVALIFFVISADGRKKKKKTLRWGSVLWAWVLVCVLCVLVCSGHERSHDTVLSTRRHLEHPESVRADSSSQRGSIIISSSVRVVTNMFGGSTGRQGPHTYYIICSSYHTRATIIVIIIGFCL